MMISFPISILAIEDENDRAFMQQLYLDYAKLMHVCALKILRNLEDTDDAVDDACIKLIGQIPKLRTFNRYVLRQYIVVTIENVAKDMIRKRRSDGEKLILTDFSADHAGGIEDGLTVEDEVQVIMDAEALRAGIAKLSERDANVLTWKYLDGLPDREIARRLQISEVGVRMAISRARMRLAALVKEANLVDNS